MGFPGRASTTSQIHLTSRLLTRTPHAHLLATISPSQVIEVWEAVVTALLMVLLICHAYYVDKKATKDAEKKYLGLAKAGQKDVRATLH